MEGKKRFYIYVSHHAMIADRTAATVAIHDVCGPGVATHVQEMVVCHHLSL